MIKRMVGNHGQVTFRLSFIGLKLDFQDFYSALEFVSERNGRAFLVW